MVEFPVKANPSEGAPDIVVLTHYASPYQIELFDEVAETSEYSLSVYYLHRSHSTRNWSVQDARHACHFLCDGSLVYARARVDFATARLAILSYYQEGPVPELIGLRARSGRPWCFWGERPGYRNRAIGRLVRRWKLRALHRSRWPIWGVGQWAVDGYRAEFGVGRDYVNLPYFENLERFSRQRAEPPRGEMIFLYSGSLSERKGVDLLCEAFLNLRESNPGVRLLIMGHGDLESRMRSELEPVGSSVEWLGFREWSELASVYARSHILCVPSRYDGWGLVVPEGLAAGLPVIATDRTGSALDLVRHGLNGWLVKARSTDALLAAMKRAATLDHKEWRTMSDAAMRSVDGHSLRHGARRFLDAAAVAMSMNGIR